MEFAELLGRLELLLEKSRVGVLTTVDDSGYPVSRWMTPVVLRGRPGFLYALTAPDSRKSFHLRTCSRVGWLFQTKSLDEVISVSGEALLIDDPQAKAEVQEAIGPNLRIFWTVNPKAGNLSVVETEIRELSCFLPLRNESHRATRG